MHDGEFGLNGRTLYQLQQVVNGFLEADEDLPTWNISYEYDKSLKIANDSQLIINIAGLAYYITAGGYRIDRKCRNSILSTCFASHDFADVMVYTRLAEEKYDFNNITYPLNQIFRYRSILCNCIMMHSSAIVYNDEAVLLCGASGAGKSTQAMLWEKYQKAVVLNYDQNCVIMNSNQIKVHGSPWAGKENCFINRSVPLKAIVFLSKSNRNQVLRADLGRAFSLIYLNNYLYPLNRVIENKYEQIISGLVRKIPVYQMNCDMSYGAVETLEDILWQA